VRLFFLSIFPYNNHMLTPEEVKKVALLARIELRDGEVEKFQKDLSAILDYVEELKQVETEGLNIVSSVTGLENVQRADEAIMIDYQEKIMANGPERKDKYYKVKSIL
jgi:aspartyl-tRNA(Asn)/glutamyl-tRNA(Gln) amidotransferase subunit C